ncbi:cob(I)yrinic acid a,c-diamide adenosyltransferase [Xylophilus ampelinus]|uniref:Corrinoid adenosyltransferase n=1 Tax=Xylophilus ampelinus TaxID=54067 RepID=A0A318SIA8_9BURK|nr:cob(I)yrinic acid a,c-diamide adenosyltransferase [Xylophilus ampelinus]MCS4509908.1 cob(I)yrinic acid a,c-diamide adenosyltransferase [Xylophilus ampelinus]PYE78542.1 cob(I)yrinic acid a,c-diamide adenosyltransferase [Xylophilus ampelinus]
MQIETPPSEKPYEKPEGERRGLVLVNTGDGKGKSTSAFGLALRAHGRGKAVKIYQFMKVPSARFGEHRAFEQLEAFRTAPGRPKPDAAPSGGSEDTQCRAWGPILEGLGDGFSWKSQDLERSARLARDGWERARAAILSGDYFLVVLDEITYPLIYGWLPLDGVLETLRSRPRDVHVMLTGRRCPPEIVELADTVTEMQMVKHAFKAGIPAQRGIED